MAIQPVGVLTRSIWTFFPDLIMAGFDQLGATGGQYSYVSLFNNDTYGRYLWVIGCSVATTNNADAIFEILQTNPGGTPSTFVPTPILSTGQLLPGQMSHLYSSVCLGTHIAGAPNVQVTRFEWPHDYPLAIIAPGQCFAIQTGVFSANISCGLWWWVGPQP